MSNINPTLANQNLVQSTTPVKLWTSSAVSATTFFLGFPGGIALASINWVRMGKTNKALLHLAGGALATILFVIFSMVMPEARWASLLGNIAILAYLEMQTRKDTEAFLSKGQKMEKASGVGAFFIGIAMLFVFLITVIATLFILSILGIPLPQ